MRRAATIVQVLSAVLAMSFALALLLPAGGTDDSLGAQVFGAECARCHGADGDGGIGPRLAGGAVLATFPQRLDQIELVESGRGDMPSFEGRLTPGEIAAVVDYTRIDLVAEGE